MKNKIILLATILAIFGTLSIAKTEIKTYSTSSKTYYSNKNNDIEQKYEYEEKYERKNGKSEFTLNFKKEDVKFDLEFRTYSGNIQVTLVDENGNKIFTETNPKNIKTIIKVKTNVDYKLILEFDNHNGKYELEIKTL